MTTQENTNQNIVFILGAGASCTYGLPIGSELALQIKNLSKNLHEKSGQIHINGLTREFWNIWREHPKFGEKMNLLVKMGNAFEGFDHDSIDLFLNTRQDEFEYVGKLLIAFLILRHERVNYLFNPPPNYNSGWPNWMKYFRKKVLTYDFNIEEKSCISFVTFNYDRTLEYYLQTVISRAHPKKDIKINEIFDIIHVYGSLGNIPIMKDGSQGYAYIDNIVDFGEHNNITIETIQTAANNLKLIYQSRADNSITDKIKKVLHNADKVFFMGFGFDKMNLDILGWDKNLTQHKKIYGTAFKYTSKEILDIPFGIGYYSSGEHKLTEKDKVIRKIEDMNCLDLLRNYF